MVDVKTNYRGSNSTLQRPLCKNEQDKKEHLLTCKKLDDGNDVLTAIPNYRDLFGENLERKVTLARIMQARFKKRKELLQKKSEIA